MGLVCRQKLFAGAKRAMPSEEKNLPPSARMREESSSDDGDDMEEPDENAGMIQELLEEITEARAANKAKPDNNVPMQEDLNMKQ